MKRADAFRKMAIVCQRLAGADPRTFFVIPLRLHVFGSVLTAKPNPTDVDLLLEFRQRPDLDPYDIARRFSYRKPLPHEQASTALRKGMKMVHIDFAPAGVDLWRQSTLFVPTRRYISSGSPASTGKQRWPSSKCIHCPGTRTASSASRRSRRRSSAL